MRILFLLTQDLESPSGLGRYWPLAKELTDRGHQVRIVALHSNFAALNEHAIKMDGVQIDYVAPMHVQKQGSQKQYYSSLQLILVAMRAIWASTRASLSSPVDIIQVCKPHPMNSLAGLLVQWLRGGILCVDCDDYEAHSNRFGSRWQRRVVAYFEQYVPRLAQLVTTHTQYMRDNLVAWGIPEERIHYLSNGVDQTRYIQPDQAYISSLRQRLGLDGKRVVAYLGSLSLPSHPVDLLIEAFKVLHEQLSTSTLLLVGGGEDVEKLIHLTHQLNIAKDVIFTGRVSPQEIPTYYALAEVTVEPIFDNEAAKGRSPLKMFESWIMGVPFITAGIGERVALAGNPPACLLFQPVGNVDSMADAILRILYSPELALTLRQRGLERVRNFTWDILATKLERLYQGLL